MAQQRQIEDRGDLLILLELERLSRATLPMHLRSLMETRTYLEWPHADTHLRITRDFWASLKDSLGPALQLTVQQNHPDEGDRAQEHEDDDDYTFTVPTNTPLL